MNIVRELRKKKGIQQKELALAIGVSAPTVSDWELNRKDPTGERLKKLAEYFGVDELVVLGKGNVVGSPEPWVPLDPKIAGESETSQILQYIVNRLDQKTQSPEMTIVTEMMGKMTRDQQKQVVAVMKAMFPDILEKATNK